MTKFVNLVVAFVCLISVTNCHVVRVRDAPAENPNALDDLIKQTQTSAAELNAKFLQLVGVKTNEELTNVIHTQSKSFVERIQGLLPQLQKEANENSDKVKEVVEGIRTRITTTIGDIHQNAPEVIPGTKEVGSQLATTLQTGIAAVANEFANLGKKLSENDDLGTKLKDVVKQIMDNTLETAQNVAKKVDSAIEENKAAP